jgi:DNA-binding GntR family transcriptional regulator
MPGATESVDSSVDTVLTYARNRIVSGDYQPGSKLLPKVLADECGTSMIPVREALRVLETEGLVSIIRNRGAWVAPLSLSNLSDLYSVRIPLETGAILAAKPFSSVDIARLEGFLDAAAEAVRRSDVAEVIALNEALHFSIYRHCESPLRLRIIEQLWAHAERYQRSALNFRDDAADAEHREIVACLARGDHSAAADALANHLETTVRVLRETLQNSGIPASCNEFA